MIYTLSEIQKKLDEIYMALANDGFDQMRLVSKKTHENTILRAECRLNIKFPLEFKELVSKYDFGKFEINNIAFGHTGNYMKELISFNVKDE